MLKRLTASPPCFVAWGGFAGHFLSIMEAVNADHYDPIARGESGRYCDHFALDGADLDGASRDAAAILRQHPDMLCARFADDRVAGDKNSGRNRPVDFDRHRGTEPETGAGVLQRQEDAVGARQRIGEWVDFAHESPRDYFRRRLQSRREFHARPYTRNEIVGNVDHSFTRFGARDRHHRLSFADELSDFGRPGGNHAIKIGI
jgi:hypothetical protein